LDRRRTWLWAQRAARWVLGGIFVYAGAAKALDPAAFAEQIKNYHFAPWWAVHPTAIVLPWIELVAGLTLIGGIWVIEAVVVLSVLLGVFIVAAGSAMYRGLDIECGCFGGEAKVGWSLIARNGGLLVLAAGTLLSRWRADRLGRR